MHIFIVEDDKDTAHTYVDSLQKNYNIAVAYSGDDAVNYIDETVDVVLLDRRMPGLSGEEVLRWIREQGFDCYVLMITAIDPDLSIVEMEFQDYLEKPISPEVLNEAIEDLLDKKRQEELIQELFHLSLRITTLESKLDVSQLQQSDKYRELQSDLDELGAEFEEYFAGEFAHMPTVERIQSVLMAAAA